MAGAHVDLTQKDLQAYILEQLGHDLWVPIYGSQKQPCENVYFYSALVPNSQVEKVLSNTTWDLTYGQGMPGCVQYGDGRVEYHRASNDLGLEPLVLYRDYYGLRERSFELSEEFRLLFNLYHDTENRRYLKLDDGEDEEVVSSQADFMKVRWKYLRQFLAIKGMHVAVYFEIERFAANSLEELGLKKSFHENREGTTSYALHIGDWPARADGPRTFSRLTGKKLIPGGPRESSGIWPFEQSTQYAEFIIGADPGGEPVWKSADPERLANNFGANASEPHYLTSVYFHRKVLDRYQATPSKYSIEPTYLRCQGLWDLRYDTTSDHVVAWLGDLGRDLPYKEQLHWKAFVVRPPRRIVGPDWLHKELNADGPGQEPSAPEPVSAANEGAAMVVSTPAAPSIEVFFSYCHADEALRDQLTKHLSALKRSGVITGWHDRLISPGTDWEDQIQDHLDRAQVVLLLVSADFLSSEYCWGVEVKRAMQRHEAGQARVIPIILRDVDWAGTPFAKLQALPTEAKPVTSWPNQDEAFASVARGIRKALIEITVED